MIDKEFYLFDSFGVYHKKNVFEKKLIAQANEIFENQIFQNKNDNIKFFDIDKNKVFLQLLLSQQVIQVCKSIYACNFRMDHAFIVNQNERNSHSAKNKLHGKNFGKFNAHFYVSYQQENIEKICTTKVGQISVGIVLRGQNKNTGGFCYIAGSHKSAYCVSGQDLVKTIMSDEKAFYESVTIPELDEGDLIVFSESLIHGQSKMLTPSVRRNIYGMFFPISMNYMSPDNQQIKNFIQLADDTQKEYLVSNINDLGKILHEDSASQTNRKLFIS